MDLETFTALNFPYDFENQIWEFMMSKHLNRKIDSQLDQIIFDPGIHDADKKVEKC